MKVALSLKRWQSDGLTIMQTDHFDTKWQMTQTPRLIGLPVEPYIMLQLPFILDTQSPNTLGLSLKASIPLTVLAPQNTNFPV